MEIQEESQLEMEPLQAVFAQSVPCQQKLDEHIFQPIEHLNRSFLLQCQSACPLFKWKRSVIQLMHYAFLGVATARDDTEFTQKEVNSSSMISPRKFIKKDKENKIELDLPPPVPPSSLDNLLELGASLAATRSGIRSGIVNATETLGSIFTGADFCKEFLPIHSSQTHAKVEWPCLPEISALTLPIHYVQATLRRLRSRSHPNTAVQVPQLHPQEKGILDRKLTEMERILEAELQELQDQEVDLYVEKFTEALEIANQLQQLEQMMEQQNEEVLLQQTITKLEHEENSRNPEPDSTRPALSVGDDRFTANMRRLGLNYIGSDGTDRNLTAGDLPPRLDLKQFFSAPNN
eukprot:gene3442-6080_t